MDPKIAAGFSLLGQTLMPDPGKLAQAEVYRSQMLENQANARKLGLEGDALANAAEQLGRLQDLLANRDASPEDILSRAVGANITNDPSQLPKFVLGGQALEGLDVNDPESLSRAALGTGQVASWASTPTGFGEDQARQEREAVAKDLTARQGNQLTYDASIYDTDVDAGTDIAREGMENETDLKIAQKQRQLDSLKAIREDLTKRWQIATESGDRAERLRVESQWEILKGQITTAVAEADDLTQVKIAEMNNAGEMAQTVANADAAYNRTVYSSDAAAAATRYAADARNRGGANEPTISRSAALKFQRDIKDKMARILDPTIDLKDSANVDAFLKGKGSITLPDLNDLTQLAFTLHPKDNIAAFETAMSLIRRDENGRFYIDNRAWDALVLPGEEDAAAGEDATDADDATMAPALVPEDTGAGMVTPPPGGWPEGDRKQAPNGNWVVFDGTRWLWEATGKPVE